MKKLLKKGLALLVSFVMLFSCPFVLNVSAAENVNSINSADSFKVKSSLSALSSLNGNKLTNISKVEILYGLDEQPDYLLVLLKPTGFAILLRSTYDIIEANLSAPSPYGNISGKGYYAGPLNYAEKRNNNFYNIKTGSEVNNSETQSIISNLASMNSKAVQQQKDSIDSLPKVNASRAWKKISYASYMDSGVHVAENTKQQNRCGSVAAAMMLVDYQF